MFNGGRVKDLDMLIIESAGLCNRCSPHIKDVLSICVIDNLSGVTHPKNRADAKISRYSRDNKGDIVSQAERGICL